MLIPLWQKLKCLVLQRNVQKRLAPILLPKVGVLPCVLSLWKSRRLFLLVASYSSRKADFCPWRSRKLLKHKRTELLWSAGHIGYFSFLVEIPPWSSPCLPVQTHGLLGVCRWLFAPSALSLFQRGFRVWGTKGCPRLFCGFPSSHSPPAGPLQRKGIRMQAWRGPLLICRRNRILSPQRMPLSQPGQRTLLAEGTHCPR